MNTPLSELLDPAVLGLIKRACALRRQRLAQAVLAQEPHSAEEALLMVLKARALDGVLRQIEDDPVAFFEEE